MLPQHKRRGRLPCPLPSMSLLFGAKARRGRSRTRQPPAGHRTPPRSTSLGARVLVAIVSGLDQIVAEEQENACPTGEFDSAASQAASSARRGSHYRACRIGILRMIASDLQRRKDREQAWQRFRSGSLPHATSSSDAANRVRSIDARRREASLLTAVQDEHRNSLAGALLLSAATATM